MATDRQTDNLFQLGISSITRIGFQENRVERTLKTVQLQKFMIEENY